MSLLLDTCTHLILVCNQLIFFLNFGKIYVVFPVDSSVYINFSRILIKFRQSLSEFCILLRDEDDEDDEGDVA